MNDDDVRHMEWRIVDQGDGTYDVLAGKTNPRVIACSVERNVAEHLVRLQRDHMAFNLAEEQR